jgi:hypothetical protein
MSVINNVLKNLESRESRFTPIELNAVVSDAAPVRDLKPLLLITTLFVLLAVAAWIYLDKLPTVALQPTPANVVPVTPASAPQSVVEPETSTGLISEQMIGNQIIGLQIRESEVAMRMEFVLREKVVAYLRERGENSFSYHLRDVDSQIVAPLISDNEWIRELSIIASEAGVDINFETATDILVETGQELHDGEPIWAISLRKSVTTANSEPVVEVAARSKPAVTESQSAQAPVEVVAATPPPESAVVEAPTAPVAIDIKSTNPNTTSINQLEYAVELINSRRIADAEELLRGLLGGAEDFSARQHLLALYGRQKLVDRKRQLLVESMARYPDVALFKTEYGRLLIHTADYRAVIQLFANEVSLDANQQALVAASYQRLDEHEEAVKHYQLALAQDASIARNWIGLGISQEHTAALEAALNSYQRAAKLGSLNSRLRNFIASRSNALRQVLN